MVKNYVAASVLTVVGAVSLLSAMTKGAVRPQDAQVTFDKPVDVIVRVVGVDARGVTFIPLLPVQFRAGQSVPPVSKGDILTCKARGKDDGTQVVGGQTFGYHHTELDCGHGVKLAVGEVLFSESGE